MHSTSRSDILPVQMAGVAACEQVGKPPGYGIGKLGAGEGERE